ncbi:hypothetical protein COW36_24770 [bacterium (Candidatus Blackallbacteria) CG17_big_fil_post_rev_8_21_14_2_50_48_46]|uniref:Alginate export domain-containing protein n=1 Tax=bacterium (Candidatus Blackallbacteria) CG17_big_fil_post_rev_8_21_14_2_50_48_46 TaxID=2014261 RepID=A0A2M7FXS1_9BACT|nr:MAG: hypothetical protein COW64_19710 [bacterium (Candidatus Blackallbacteria) CG18_big_fil_WC_8_21_14_2_50_49_26]PIW13882.1 MAG: hypothetical protein COW36_24770 [bacterium (Candidatus Blackallbacteria) CG17_big_fil_post_rev_8_21_14_2_50_48_46]PIW45108.1 MAG: hypothetical protein COW20_22400 [bacterium (Candidatus Blackallbacteria) CG13_big_fil_rev_8_21_14_2_50_49_14]
MQKKYFLKMHNWVMAFTLLTSGFYTFQFSAQAADIRSSATLSEVTQVLSEAQIKVLTSIEQDKLESVPDEIMTPFSTYLDLNVIGRGKLVNLDLDRMANAIVEWANQSKTSQEISGLIIASYQQGLFEPQKEENQASTSDKKEDLVKTSLGGFFVGEFEYHQEPDGVFQPLVEINKANLFFSAQVMSPQAPNNIYFLAEWNPVPEEVVHQIDSLNIDDNGTLKTLELPSLTGNTATSATDAAQHVHEMLNGQIPFERLYLKVGNLLDSGVELSVGQFRNPFGIWSDYTSHRNFTSTKNNTLVNGFALKKLELGLMANKSFDLGFANSKLDLTAAIVHGRQGRTFPLYRADTDTNKDFVGHLSFENPAVVVGTSAYVGNLGRNLAFGGDFLVPTKYINFSGEYVFQQNNDVNATFGTHFTSFNTAASHSGYLQFDFAFLDLLDGLGMDTLSKVARDLHIYGMYEMWSYYTGGKLFNQPEVKIFHGLRHQINKNTRWTILEYGHLFHQGYDKGDVHLSSQLEFTF